MNVGDKANMQGKEGAEKENQPGMLQGGYLRHGVQLDAGVRTAENSSMHGKDKLGIGKSAFVAAG